MKEILRRLVAFHTVATDVQAMHEGMDYIADFVAKRGMHVERFDAGGIESLVATVTPGHKTPKVMLAAHLDVVPAPDALFEMREGLDGKLYGRGTLDMKFAIAAYLQLIDELQDRLKNYDIGLMITTDEEQGGPSVARLLDEGYAPQVCIVPDGGDNWQIQVHSKGFFYMRAATYGKPAHASRPWLGQNAILPLLEVVQEVQALFPENKPETSTLNVGKITGGTTINQVADYAEALLDIRYINRQDRDHIHDAVSAICERHDAELAVVVEGNPTEFSLDDPLIAPFAQAITEVTGVKVDGSRTMGSNDTRHFAAKNIPCVSFYPTGAGHHGPEEWLEEKAFYQFKAVLELYLDRVARISPPPPRLLVKREVQSPRWKAPRAENSAPTKS